MIIVSHDPECVRELSPDRVLMMPDGVLAYLADDLLDLVGVAHARGHVGKAAMQDQLGTDRIDLYHVVGDTPNFEPGETIDLIVRFNGRRITPRPSTGGDLLASLAAATGFYESPSGELIFYATEHDNDGPSETLRAGEWRHINMVRENSPTLLPGAVVNGPYAVDEGSTVTLTGSAFPPRSSTRPSLRCSSSRISTTTFRSRSPSPR